MSNANPYQGRLRGSRLSSSRRRQSGPSSPISDLDPRTLAKAILKITRPPPDVAHTMFHFIVSTKTTGSMFLNISDEDLKRVLAKGDQQLFNQLKGLRHQPHHFYEELFRRLSSSMPNTPQLPSRPQITTRDSKTPATSVMAETTTNVPVTQERSDVAPEVIRHAAPTFVVMQESDVGVDTGNLVPLSLQSNTLGLHVDSQVPQTNADAADDNTVDAALPQSDPEGYTCQTHEFILSPSVILHPLPSGDKLANGHPDIERRTPIFDQSCQPGDDSDRNIHKVQNDILSPPISPSSQLLPLLSDDRAGYDIIVISVIPPDDDITPKHYSQDTTQVSLSAAQLPSPSESQNSHKFWDNFTPDHSEGDIEAQPTWASSPDRHDGQEVRGDPSPSTPVTLDSALDDTGQPVVDEIEDHSEMPVLVQPLCSRPDGNSLNGATYTECPVDSAPSDTEKEPQVSAGEVDDAEPLDSAHTTTPVSVVINPGDSTAPSDDSTSVPQEELSLGHFDEYAKGLNGSDMTPQTQVCSGPDDFMGDDDPSIQELGAENDSEETPTSAVQEHNLVDFLDAISDPMPQSAVLRPSLFAVSPPIPLSHAHDSLPGDLQARQDSGIPLASTTPNSESTAPHDASTSSVDNAMQEDLQPLADGARYSDLPAMYPNATSGDDVAEPTMVGSRHTNEVDVQLFDSSPPFSPAISSSWSTLATDAISPKVYLMDHISPDTTFHSNLGGDPRFVYVPFVEEPDNDDFRTSTPFRIPGALPSDVREEVLSSNAGTQASSGPDILDCPRSLGLGEPSSEGENHAGIPLSSPLQVETSADIAPNDIFPQNTLGLSVTDLDSAVQQPALITTASDSVDSNIEHGDAEATLVEHNVQSAFDGKQTLSLLLPCPATTSFLDEISPSIDLIFGPPSATANLPFPLPESSRRQYSRGSRTLWPPSDLISDGTVQLERERRKQASEYYIDVGTQTEPETQADRSSSYLPSPLSALFSNRFVWGK